MSELTNIIENAMKTYNYEVRKLVYKSLIETIKWLRKMGCKDSDIIDRIIDTGEIINDIEDI